MKPLRILRMAGAVGLALAPGWAAADEARPTLAEAMEGATSMTTVANALLFIAKEREAWICAINVSSNHFAALAAGDDVVAEQTVPGALCVPATHFKNLME
jgi:hypothetical protein